MDSFLQKVYKLVGPSKNQARKQASKQGSKQASKQAKHVSKTRISDKNRTQTTNQRSITNKLTQGANQ